MRNQKESKGKKKFFIVLNFKKWLTEMLLLLGPPVEIPVRVQGREKKNVDLFKY